MVNGTFILFIYLYEGLMVHLSCINIIYQNDKFIIDRNRTNKRRFTCIRIFPQNKTPFRKFQTYQSTLQQPIPNFL